MSHLTDGEIHVHLDGALDLLPDHRAAEIRSHLSRCEDCNARMEEERRIRERASEVLESPRSAEARGSPGGAAEATGPATGGIAAPIPSFETIRERAAGGAGSDGSTGMEEEGEGRSGRVAFGRSRESWLRGMAWAATVILSLGVGWYARSGVVETDVRARPVLRSPTGPVAGADQSPGTGAPAGDRTPSDEAVAEAPAPARLPEAVTPEAASTAGVERSLAVTGLPVISVGWESDAGEESPTLTVVQRLPSGDPLSLRYTALQPEARAGFTDETVTTLEAADGAARDSPIAEAPSLPSRTPVVRRHGPWLLEASAPLAPDSLRALLNRLPAPE